MFRAILVILFLFAAACASEEPAGTDPTNITDLASMLELDLQDLQPKGDLDQGLLSQVSMLVAEADINADSVEFYTASTTIDEEFQPVKIGTVRFSGKLSAAAAAVVVDESGFVKTFRFWGVDDENADWENFWRQFEYKNTRQVLDASVANSDSASLAFVNNLAESEDRFMTNAYRHILLMRSNSQVVRTTMALTTRDETPSPEFYQHFVDHMVEMSKIFESFEPIVGSNAVAEYLKVVDDATASLESISTVAEQGNSRAVRRAIGDYRRKTCGSCHGIESHSLGEGELDDAVLDYFNSNGVNRDWYRVGLDVWAVPGQAEASQTVASTLKALLMLMKD